MKVLIAIAILVLLVWLKRKYDPHNDAFRTTERVGWHFKKATVVSLEEYRKHKNGN